MSKLYFRYGAMNCGKTTSLLQVAYNYEERGMKILLIKPTVDIKNYILNNKYDAIIIDEAQFLNSKQVDELYFITKEYDIPVL